MLRIAICDDNIPFTGELETLIIQICGENQVKITKPEVFFTGFDLLREMKKGEEFDLFYLDIEMKPDGITLAKEIRSMNEKALFVFISTHCECCEQLFDVDTFAFIRKPVERLYVESVLLKAHNRIKKMRHKEFYSYTYGSDKFQIVLDSIFYFKSVGRQIEINLRDNEIRRYNGKMNDVEESIRGKNIPFLRIHQSYLVNYERIVGYNRDIVKLIDDQKLPISAERRDVFTKSFNRLVGGDISE